MAHSRKHEREKKRLEEKGRVVLAAMGIVVPPSHWRMIQVAELIADPFYNHKTAGGNRLRTFMEIVRLVAWKPIEVTVKIQNGLVDKFILQQGERWFRGRGMAEELRMTHAALLRVLESGEKADHWKLKTGSQYGIISLQKYIVFSRGKKNPDHRVQKTGSRSILISEDEKNSAAKFVKSSPAGSITFVERSEIDGSKKRFLTLEAGQRRKVHKRQQELPLGMSDTTRKHISDLHERLGI